MVSNQLAMSCTVFIAHVWLCRAIHSHVFIAHVWLFIAHDGYLYRFAVYTTDGYTDKTLTNRTVLKPYQLGDETV